MHLNNSEQIIIDNLYVFFLPIFVAGVIICVVSVTGLSVIVLLLSPSSLLSSSSSLDPVTSTTEAQYLITAIERYRSNVCPTVCYHWKPMNKR